MLKLFVRTVPLLIIACMVLACSQRTMNLLGTGQSSSSAVSVEDRKKIRQLLAQEEYTRALDMMKGKIRAGATEQDFSTLYVTAMNGLISKGEDHLKRNEQSQAGLVFRRALDRYPSNEPMQQKVKRSSADIQQTLERLSVDMMDAALLKYRAGEIKKAIAIWDGILSFDPQNAEAKKARDTAATQLENLKKMK